MSALFVLSPALLPVEAVDVGLVSGLCVAVPELPAAHTPLLIAVQGGVGDVPFTAHTKFEVILFGVCDGGGEISHPTIGGEHIGAPTDRLFPRILIGRDREIFARGAIGDLLALADRQPHLLHQLIISANNVEPMSRLLRDLPGHEIMVHDRDVVVHTLALAVGVCGYVDWRVRCKTFGKL